MKKKIYRYFVSFVYADLSRMDINEFHGNATLVYDEPLNTPEMISRAERDIKHLISNGDVTIEHDSVTIIFFKRIKENRVEA